MQSEPTTQRNLYYPSYPFSFFLTHTAPPDISTLSLHDALPISPPGERRGVSPPVASPAGSRRAARPHCTMKTETPASELERRKKVRLRIRPDLDIAPQKYEGRTYYVVKDPVSLRYYRFKEQEQFLIRMMDGAVTLDDAQKAYEKRFRPERLTLEDLEHFAQQLLTAGLAHNESPQAGKQVFDR